MNYEEMRHEIELKEIERYDYSSVHGDVVVITTDPSSVSAISVHGSVIVASSVQDVELILREIESNKEAEWKRHHIEKVDDE